MPSNYLKPGAFLPSYSHEQQGWNPPPSPTRQVATDSKINEYWAHLETLKRKTAGELLTMLEEVPFNHPEQRSQSDQQVKAIIEAEEVDLADRIIARRQAELRSSMHKFSKYGSLPSIVDGLAHLLDHKDIWLFDWRFPSDFAYAWTSPDNLGEDAFRNLKSYVRGLIDLHLSRYSRDESAILPAGSINDLANRLRSLHFPSPAVRIRNDGSRNDDISRVLRGGLGDPAVINTTTSLPRGGTFDSKFMHVPLTDLWVNSEPQLPLVAARWQKRFLDSLGLPRAKGSLDGEQYRPLVAYAVKAEQRDEALVACNGLLMGGARPLVLAWLMEMINVY